MLWALDATGNRIEPSKGIRAICLGCSGEVRAHCGRLLIDHWHHEAGDCDPWSEPETQWHRDWKECYEESECEIWKSPHRADVRLRSGSVLEFQHSPISPDEIVARERFWKDLIWVFVA